MVSTKINQLQLLQHNLQAVVMQKQQVQNQLVELNSAITGLNETEKAYRIVGGIMISAPKEELLTSLREKKDISEIRLSNVIKHEEKLTKEIEKLQKEVVSGLKHE